MIVYFPELYPDELLYSQLARYYVKSGYLCYWYAAEDLFQSKKVRPDIEFNNAYTSAALEMILENMPMESIIRKHTMFNYYGRFLPKQRRNRAFKALVEMQGDYNNLLPIPKNKQGKERHLRYCPMCARNDRQQYAETYWHRIHQMQGVNICPVHCCYLINSDVVISGKASPNLVAAENVVPTSKSVTVTMCENEVECRLAKYVMNVFQADIDLQSDVLVGDFLHSRMSGTKYLSARGEQRNIGLFHSDFIKFYICLSDNYFTEIWQIQKVFNTYRLNTNEICMMAMFLNVSAADLVNMALPEKTQEQLFDEQIYKLHEDGLKYPEIAKRLNASINVVKPIGEKRYGANHKEHKETLKCGVKAKNWKQIDTDTLPKVQKAIKQLQGDGIRRPKRVTKNAVELLLGLPSGRFKHLPMCRKEIEKHTTIQAEYWALEIVWAYNKIVREGQVMNWKHIRMLTNMRKKDLSTCMPYLQKITSIDVVQKIEGLL